MSSQVHVVAIVTPAPGQFKRVKDLLAGLADNVYKHEPDAPKYQVFEQVGSENGVNALVVQETYKDQATFDGHFKTEYFQTLGKALAEENLLAAPLDIKTVKPFAGFASR